MKSGESSFNFTRAKDSSSIDMNIYSVGRTVGSLFYQFKVNSSLDISSTRTVPLRAASSRVFPTQKNPYPDISPRTTPKQIFPSRTIPSLIDLCQLVASRIVPLGKLKPSIVTIIKKHVMKTIESQLNHMSVPIIYCEQ